MVTGLRRAPEAVAETLEVLEGGMDATAMPVQAERFASSRDYDQRARSPRSVCDDIRNLVFFLVAQVGRPGMQAGNQIAVPR